MATLNAKRQSSMPRSAYRVANYDGSNGAHPVPEESGTLFLGPDDDWLMSFTTREFRGSLRRFPLDVTSVGSTSCSVKVHFALDPSKAALFSFDLPDTLADEIELDLHERGNGDWTAEDEQEWRFGAIDSKYSISFSALYLGGLPLAPQKAPASRTVVFRAAGMFYESKYSSPEQICGWSEVQAIDIEGGEIAKRRVAAALTFGILGAVSAKGTKDRIFVLLKLKDGSEGIWQIDKVPLMEARAAVRPLLHEVGVDFGSEAPPAAQKVSEAINPPSALPLVADELAKLGELRDKGLLTDEEFAAQKARLLQAT